MAAEIVTICRGLTSTCVCTDALPVSVFILYLHGVYSWPNAGWSKHFHVLLYLIVGDRYDYELLSPF